MMPFFVLVRAIFYFVISVAFKEGELSINKSTFNPVKVLVVIFIVCYIVISLILLVRLFSLYIAIENLCPGINKVILGLPDGDGVAGDCKIITI